MKQRINAISVQQAGKITGLFYACLTCLFAPVGLVIAVAAHHNRDRVAGLMFMLLPIPYGLAGYALGALGAFVYNMLAKHFGGLELIVEEVDDKT